jgi:hypothetical protein
MSKKGRHSLESLIEQSASWEQRQKFEPAESKAKKFVLKEPLDKAKCVRKLRTSRCSAFRKICTGSILATNMTLKVLYLELKLVCYQNCRFQSSLCQIMADGNEPGTPLNPVQQTSRLKYSREGQIAWTACCKTESMVLKRFSYDILDKH